VHVSKPLYRPSSKHTRPVLHAATRRLSLRRRGLPHHARSPPHRRAVPTLAWSAPAGGARGMPSSHAPLFTARSLCGVHSAGVEVCAHGMFPRSLDWALHLIEAHTPPNPKLEAEARPGWCLVGQVV
jgi:hypothetical protein